MTGADLERLARTAYEAHRAAHPAPLPPWEDIAGEEREAWKAAVSAIAEPRRITRIEPVPTPSLLIKYGDRNHTFHTSFTAGRQGNLVIDDDYASGHHARFQISGGRWYVEDLGSTNGTWLNGRRIHAAQRLAKGDTVRIGHTVITVEPV